MELGWIHNQGSILGHQSRGAPVHDLVEFVHFWLGGRMSWPKFVKTSHCCLVLEWCIQTVFKGLYFPLSLCFLYLLYRRFDLSFWQIRINLLLSRIVLYEGDFLWIGLSRLQLCSFIFVLKFNECNYLFHLIVFYGCEQDLFEELNLAS